MVGWYQITLHTWQQTNEEKKKRKKEEETKKKRLYGFKWKIKKKFPANPINVNTSFKHHK